MLNFKRAVLATATMLLAMPAIAAPGADVYGARARVSNVRTNLISPHPTLSSHLIRWSLRSPQDDDNILKAARSFRI